MRNNIGSESYLVTAPDRFLETWPHPLRKSPYETALNTGAKCLTLQRLEISEALWIVIFCVVLVTSSYELWTSIFSSKVRGLPWTLPSVRHAIAITQSLQILADLNHHVTASYMSPTREEFYVHYDMPLTVSGLGSPRYSRRRHRRTHCSSIHWSCDER